MDEFVMVPVPTSRVRAVYALLGAPDETEQHAGAVPGGAVRSTPEAGPNGAAAWARDGIARMYRESSKAMRRVLDHLADHPDQEFTTQEMAAAIDRRPEQFRGVLGAFGHRVSSRYRWTQWPFMSEWRSDVGHVVYSMSLDVADIIREARESA